MRPAPRIRMQHFCWSKWAPHAPWLLLPSSCLLYPLHTMCKAVQTQGCTSGEGLLWKLAQALYPSNLKRVKHSAQFPPQHLPLTQSLTPDKPRQLYEPRHFWVNSKEIKPGAPSSLSWAPKKIIQASARKWKKIKQSVWVCVCKCVRKTQLCFPLST